ncbi:MAG: Asp-tRNA(Asn)/Glu-tRNA(Gln) amidotransferase subunit GatC [Bifidobacteriaceae bacterium]|nr:Asp-tRNA(Asn)/Glu-tRNA(Gln) amidotransferase subunit GatC [Bifidobacteriaceae bacterium]
MSEFSYEQVKHLAKLACIALSDEEIEAMKEDLQGIVKSVALISDIDIAGVEPTTNPISLPSHIRDDVAGETLQRDVLLEQAPECEDGMFVTPRILGDE